MSTMDLRPHHVLDIVTGHGNDEEFVPHPYGHAVHSVARAILADLGLQIRLVVGADAICYPCRHLQADRSCDDVLSQLDPPIAKQGYNDDLDRRLLDYLGLAPDTVMTVGRYLSTVNERVPGIEALCTHPKEDRQQRLDGLARGLSKLGIRSG